MTNQTKNSMLLMLCALIWGTAFVAQSAGSGMGAFSFLAGRSWMAVLVLIPTVKAFDALHHRQGRPDGKPKTTAERKLLLKAGLMCGTLLFLASAAQQLGITLDPSTAKAGFLTAMYVVLVPVFGLFLGRKGSAQLWVSMVVAVLGLYLLCMKNGFGSIESSDWLLLSCAVLFSFQIMSIDHFSPLVDGVRLSLIQFIVVAVVCVLFLWHLRSALVAIISLPLGIMAAFLVMRYQGINANIMSLGGIAIAIGAMVDAAVVMIENAHKKIEAWHAANPGEELNGERHWHVMTEAAAEVGPALFFCLLIITLSFIPVFTLEAQEGRLFGPLAFTKT